MQDDKDNDIDGQSAHCRSDSGLRQQGWMHCLMGSDGPGLSPREQQMSFSQPKNNSESTLGLLGGETIGLDGTGNIKCTFKMKTYNNLHPLSAAHTWNAWTININTEKYLKHNTRRKRHELWTSSFIYRAPQH